MSRNYGKYALSFEKVCNEHYGKPKQLYSCKAEILYPVDFDGNLLFLKSYETVVAVADTYIGVIIAFGTYSSTTSQHIYKFAKYLDIHHIIFVDNETGETKREVHR